MSDRYSVFFAAAAGDDLSLLSLADKRRIVAAIDQRLTVDPAAYGKPLGGSFAGLRRIRVGDYRVVFRVKRRIVIVLAASHRKTVYQELAKRISRAR